MSKMDEATEERRRLNNRRYVILLITKYRSGDQKRKNGRGRLVAHMMTGGVLTGFWWGELRVRDNLEDQGIDGRIILQERQCMYKRNIVACLANNC